MRQPAAFRESRGYGKRVLAHDCRIFHLCRDGQVDSVAGIAAGDTVRGHGATVSSCKDALFGQILFTDPADPARYFGAAVTFPIYDSGGTDLLSLGPDRQIQRIGLNPGANSDILGRRQSGHRPG